jgi:hypothetical protein
MKQKPCFHTLDDLLTPLAGYRHLLDRRLADLTARNERDREAALLDLRRLINEICDSAERASQVVDELKRMLDQN